MERELERVKNTHMDYAGLISHDGHKNERDDEAMSRHHGWLLTTSASS